MRLIVLYILTTLTACHNTSEITVRKWPSGEKKIAYKIFSGDTSNLVDVYFKVYYPNGQVFKEGPIKNGFDTGEWKHYYQSGKMKSRGNFANGKKNGEFETYYESGEVEQKGTYLNDTIVRWKLYNQDGTPINGIQDLRNYLVPSPKKWASEEKQEIWIDYIMAMEPMFNNVNAFCDCILDSFERHTSYRDIRPLTEYQRTIILSYITNNRKDCFGLLTNKKLSE